MVEKYSHFYSKDNNISKHFKVGEFASINGTILYTDTVLIDTDIVKILEQLFEYLNAYKIVITSGYRTEAHEKKVGNKSGKGYHTTGQAVDINVWKDSRTRYTAREIALALEDLGWNHGIGLISNTAVHIDSRDSKYYFDESKGCKSIGNSFYDFYGVVKSTSDREKVKNKFDLNETAMLHMDRYEVNGVNYSKELYKKLLK